MDKGDTIVMIGVGGALGLILWLTTQNKNKVNLPSMPYGWGSFQNSQNLTQLTSPVSNNTPAPPAQTTEPPMSEADMITLEYGKMVNTPWGETLISTKENPVKIPKDWYLKGYTVTPGYILPLYGESGGNYNPIQSMFEVKPLVLKHANTFNPHFNAGAAIKPVMGRMVI